MQLHRPTAQLCICTPSPPAAQTPLAFAVRSPLAWLAVRPSRPPASPTLWPRGSRQHKFANRSSPLSHPSRPGPRATTESTTPSRGMLRCERDPQNGRPRRVMPCRAVQCSAVPRSTHTHTHTYTHSHTRTHSASTGVVQRLCQRQRTNVVAVNESGLCSLKELRELRPSLKTPLLLLLPCPGFNEPPRPTLTTERTNDFRPLPGATCRATAIDYPPPLDAPIHPFPVSRSTFTFSREASFRFPQMCFQTECVGQ